MLCKTCQTGLSQIQSGNSSLIQHHNCSEDINKSSLEGCFLCTRINWVTGELKNRGGTWRSKLYTHWEEADLDKNEKDRVLNLNLKAQNTVFDEGKFNHNYGNSANFRLIPVTPQKDRLKLPGYTPTNIVGDETSLGLVHYWIDTCDKYHVLCKRPQTALELNWKPTRLIFINNKSYRLQLVQGRNLPVDAKYVTLSHCWGRVKDKLVLTKSKLGDWSREMPYLGNWKTFADAVRITRQLGISYLWIDSLCIIQDSHEDWQSECPEMSNVYKRSWCNLAATAASNDAIGCCFDRDVDIDLPLRLLFTSDDDVVADVPKYSHMIIKSESNPNTALKGSYDLCESQTWIRDISGSVLNNRGWRTISPRVLNFTKREMYWECDEFQASESYPYGFPAEPSANVKFKEQSPFSLKHKIQGGMTPKDATNAAFEIWGRAVQAYTRGGGHPDLEEEGIFGFCNNLSHPSDKLVAFSAIIRELEPHMNCRYLAGHWEKNLIRQLPWTGQDWSERPTEYQAPSWSWASVNAPIEDFDSLNRAEDEDWYALLEIRDVQIELATDDHLGQVKSGTLHVQGILIDLEIQSFVSSRFLAQKPLKLNEEEIGEIILVEGERTCLHAQQDDELNPWVTPCYLYCLPICLILPRKTNRMILDWGRVEFQSILLEPADEENTYRRVGYLGLGLGQELSKQNFDQDPILRSLGLYDWRNESAVFVPDVTNWKSIIII